MTEVAEKGKRLGQSPQIVIFITYSYNHEGLCDTTIIKTLIIRVLINAFMIVAIGYYVDWSWECYASSHAYVLLQIILYVPLDEVLCANGDSYLLLTSLTRRMCYFYI